MKISAQNRIALETALSNVNDYIEEGEPATLEEFLSCIPGAIANQISIDIEVKRKKSE